MAETIFGSQLGALISATAMTAACCAGTAVLLRSHPALARVKLASNPSEPSRGSILGAVADWVSLGLGSGLVLAWSALAMPASLVVPSVLLGSTLLALAIFDARAMVLPNVLTLFLAACGLAVTGLMMPDLLLEHVVGAAVGFGSLIAVAQIYRAVRGRPGLGMGDAKLLGAAGTWVSWTGLSNVVLIGAASGLVYGVLVALVSGRSLREERIPFGVFLTVGIWMTWLYAP